jgi:hypothetical protein
VGGAAGLAAVILVLVVVIVLAALAGVSVYLATRGRGKTYFKVRAVGVVLEFGSEIEGSCTHGDRSAEPEILRAEAVVLEGRGQVQQGQLKIETKPPPVELPRGRRRWRWPRKRAPSGGEA